MTETAVKHFTIAEANATLPYVRKIVEDIVAEYERWRDAIYRYELLAAGSKAEGGETEEQVELRVAVDEIAQRINEYINELTAVGCIFKGFDGGLVDFYSRHDDHDVFLCWKLGEPDVSHWHELDSGFAGRMPIGDDFTHGESE